MITNSYVIMDRGNLGKLGEKPQMIGRDTWKVIESFQLHISHHKRLYSIVKVMPGFSCDILGYLRHYGNFGKMVYSTLIHQNFHFIFLVTWGFKSLFRTGSMNYFDQVGHEILQNKYLKAILKTQKLEIWSSLYEIS